MAARHYAASATLFLSLLVPTSAHAVWPHDPTIGNVPIRALSGSVNAVTSVSDGAGGAIMTWSDPRTGNSHIYAQRVSAAGVPLWTANGVPICTAASDQNSPIIVSDGAGGAIIAWYDLRSGNYDVYAQRVNPAGVVQWTANGVAVCILASTQLNPCIVTDGAGGALIAWQDGRSGTSYDIFAQRLNAAGVSQWTANGIALCSAVGNQVLPSIASDGAAGAIVTWDDFRSGTNYDLYGQRVNGAGFIQWAVDGAAISAATGDQSGNRVASDGAGGAIVAWVDYRSGLPDIYAQHMHMTGGALWTANGIAICNATNNQYLSTVVADGAGGAVLAWNDFRGGATYDVYVQRLTASGVVTWGANGLPVCTAALDQLNPTLVADGSGGVIVAWEDSRGNVGADIYAQHVSGSGAIMWASNGLPMCTAAYNQWAPVPVTDGNGGAILGWRDIRGGLNYDVYAQRVDAFGYMGAEPAIASVRDVANDQGGRVRVAFNASWLDGASDPNLAAYDIYRSTPVSGALAAIQSGAALRSTFAAPPVHGERGFVVDPARSQLYAWEYIGTVSPAHFITTYGFIAPTYGDSIAGSNPYAIFMVVGRNSSGSMYWLSAADSGYSVDNLGPATPAPFNGNYAGGATHLHWDPNSEADLAGYRLYRGSSAGFVPGPGNLVSAQADTGYIDAGAAGSYYKLSAVDIHGNESPFALLSPNGTTDVPHPPSGFALWLAGAVPNPAIRVAEIHFTLAQEDFVRVRIIDAAGRLVRDVSSARLPAGPNVVHWDARRADGTSAPAGLYFVRLDSGGRTLTRRMALMR